MIFYALGSLAECERQLIVDRTNAGLAVAGPSPGRPWAACCVGGGPTVMSPQRAAEARTMRDDGTPLAKIASVLGVECSPVTRALTDNQGPFRDLDSGT